MRDLTISFASCLLPPNHNPRRPVSSTIKMPPAILCLTAFYSVLLLSLSDGTQLFGNVAPVVQEEATKPWRDLVVNVTLVNGSSSPHSPKSYPLFTRPVLTGGGTEVLYDFSAVHEIPLPPDATYTLIPTTCRLTVTLWSARTRLSPSVWNQKHSRTHFHRSMELPVHSWNLRTSLNQALNIARDSCTISQLNTKTTPCAKRSLAR